MTPPICPFSLFNNLTPHTLIPFFPSSSSLRLNSLVVRSTVLNLRKGTGTGVFVTGGDIAVSALAFELTLAMVVVVSVVPSDGIGGDEVVAVVYVAFVYNIPFVVK